MGSCTGLIVEFLRVILAGIGKSGHFGLSLRMSTLGRLQPCDWQ